MKISLITVCYNSEKTIQSTIQSVLYQKYDNIEYIIIDGNSSDGTLSIIDNFKRKIFHVTSENDAGIYDAMNKGVLKSTGDIIGFLHSDDSYPDQNVLSNVIEAFSNNKKIDAVIGDVALFDQNKKMNRYYSGDSFNFDIGIMPPHPAVFIKKKCYTQFGLFNKNYRIAADYDFLFRLFKIKNIKYFYSKKILVHMKMGGISNKNFLSKIRLNREIYNIHKTHHFPISLINLLKKIPIRIEERLSK